MRRIVTVLSLVALALALTAQATSAPLEIPTVYSAGYVYDGTFFRACLWTDGALTILPGDPNHNAYAKAVFAVGSSVYVAGEYFNGSRFIPCYWENGTRTDLPGGSDYLGGVTNSIYVSQGDVYVAGHYFDGSNYIACYWKNGSRVDLPEKNAGQDGTAVSIQVVDDSVIVAGFYHKGLVSYTVKYPCYWKDGTRFDLPDGPGEADSVFVEKGRTYISGCLTIRGNASNSRIHTVACLWVDGQLKILGGPAETGPDCASSIFESNGSVYAAGWNVQRGARACIWEDSDFKSLEISPGQQSRATSVFVYEGKVYCAGYQQNYLGAVACYWIDGQVRSLHSMSGAHAVSIFVVDQ